MSFRFEKLAVWQDARTYASEIYKLTNNFPEKERFGLTDQMRRAAVSVALNIAEGSDRKSDVEFTRFLRIALTSVNEVVTALYIALDQSYLKRDDFDKMYEGGNRLAIKINALIKSIKK